MRVTHNETFSIVGLSRQEIQWLQYTVNAATLSLDGMVEYDSELKFLLALDHRLEVALSETDGRKL